MVQRGHQTFCTSSCAEAVESGSSRVTKQTAMSSPFSARGPSFNPPAAASSANAHARQTQGEEKVAIARRSRQLGSGGAKLFKCQRFGPMTCALNGGRRWRLLPFLRAPATLPTCRHPPQPQRQRRGWRGSARRRFPPSTRRSPPSPLRRRPGRAQSTPPVKVLPQP